MTVETYIGDEIERLRKKNARLQEMLEPFAKAYNDTIAAASLAPRFVKKGHEIFFEEEPYRAGCGLTEMYDVSNENRSLTFKNVVLSQEITRLREETARLRADNEWQPIDTAPADESVWLYGGWICTGDEAVANTGVMAWLVNGVWVVEEGATVVKGPTYWKRLPMPPADLAAAIREGGND